MNKSILPLFLLSVASLLASAEQIPLEKEIEIVQGEIERHQVTLKLLEQRLKELEKEKRIGGRTKISIFENSITLNGEVTTVEALKEEISKLSKETTIYLSASRTIKHQKVNALLVLFNELQYHNIVFSTSTELEPGTVVNASSAAGNSGKQLDD